MAGTSMFGILSDRTFRHLFGAQVLSLLGSGLATVALALLAYDLAEGSAGLVLGTAFAIKMIAYVGISPLAGVLAGHFPRRGLLVTLDVCRGALVILLPFVTEVWHVYVLVFLFQSCSAAFTPTFQATIPDVLTDERAYTRALSLSRMAYDLESLLSPALAALLLMFIGFHWLFLGTSLGFLVSALLVLSVSLPRPETAGQVTRRLSDRLMRGARIYLATPRLRGLFALSLAVAAAGSMVIVNTVVLVRERLDGNEEMVAVFLAAYGAGSMMVALTLPGLLERVDERRAMLAGAFIAVAGLSGAVVISGVPDGLLIWAVLGAGTALILTPSGRLLARSSHAEDRPALYAAHFAMSHACWLLAYPLAGWLGLYRGLSETFLLMAVLAAVAALLALRQWPAGDPRVIEHEHGEMRHAHAHVHDEHHQHDHDGWEGPEPHVHEHRHAAVRHSHVYVIDDHHPEWARGF